MNHPVDGEFRMQSLHLAYPLYQIGFVLVLLRWAPPMGWLARVRALDGFVSMVNNRAVTIYLWHVAAIGVAVYLIDPALGPWERPGGLPGLAVLPLMLLFLAPLVLALGWVEDLAARRRPRLSPFVRRPGAEAPAEGCKVEEPTRGGAAR